MCNAQGNLVRWKGGRGRIQSPESPGTWWTGGQEQHRWCTRGDKAPEGERRHSGHKSTCTLHLWRRCPERASELACCSSKERLGDVWSWHGPGAGSSHCRRHGEKAQGHVFNHLEHRDWSLQEEGAESQIEHPAKGKQTPEGDSNPKRRSAEAEEGFLWSDRGWETSTHQNPRQPEGAH